MKRDSILARALWHRFERSFQLDNVLNSEALSLVKHKINCQIESINLKLLFKAGAACIYSSVLRLWADASLFNKCELIVL